jgi:hypothetical protein
MPDKLQWLREPSRLVATAEEESPDRAVSVCRASLKVDDRACLWDRASREQQNKNGRNV